MNVDQVLNRLVDDIESGANHFHAHLACAGYRHRVRVDRLETLLEDRLLTTSWGDLLLALVTVEVFFENRIDHEARSMKKQKTHKSAIRNVRILMGC